MPAFYIALVGGSGKVKEKLTTLENTHKLRSSSSSLKYGENEKQGAYEGMGIAYFEYLKTESQSEF